MSSTVTPPGVVGIKAIQQEFDRYQRAAFEERVPAFFALELAGECGELANMEKKIWRDPAKAPSMDAVADEAADVFIALMNYANSRGFNLEEKISDKLKRIEQKRISGQMGPAKGQK